MNYKLLYHDLSLILRSMKYICGKLRYSCDKNDLDPYNIDYINYLEFKIDSLGHKLDIYLILDKIRNSQLKIYFKIPISLYKTLIAKESLVESDLVKSKGLFLAIVYDNSELMFEDFYVEDYYLTAINCILDNAFTYASPGSIICVKLYSNKLVISNVGIPIQEDEQNHIYDYEYRGKAAKRMSHGNGYGLYIAKKVFDAYESKISITSESIYNRNKEVESLIYSLIESQPKDNTNSIAWEELTDADYDAACNTIKKICEIYDMSSNSENHILNKIFIKNWLCFWNEVICKRREFEYEDEYESMSYEPKAKITVTIMYGKEKENTNN